MRPAHTGEAVLTAYVQQVIRIKARQLSRKRGFSRSDQDDLEQDLAMHLLQQARHYDPRRASLNTFAARVIESKARMILRDRRRLKRAAGFTARSLEERPQGASEEIALLRDRLTAADLGRRTGAVSDDPGRNETIAAIVEALQTLPSELQKVCRQLMEGNVSSAARDLDTSRRQVHSAIERIRLHFEKCGLGDSSDSRTPDPPTA